MKNDRRARYTIDSQNFTDAQWEILWSITVLPLKAKTRTRAAPLYTKTREQVESIIQFAQWIKSDDDAQQRNDRLFIANHFREQLGLPPVTLVDVASDRLLRLLTWDGIFTKEPKYAPEIAEIPRLLDILFRGTK